MPSAIEARGRSLARAVRLERPLVAVARFLTRGRHWCRVVMDRSIDEVLDRLDRSRLDAVEVSGTAHRDRGWRSYASLAYPSFDLCDPPAEMPQFDVVLCEQVLEHVVDPYRAARMLHNLTRPGGTIVVSTPFLLRIHQSPGDYWRFTPDGLAILLRSAGLDVASARSWGNAACVRGNFRRWKVYRPWHALHDDPDLPVVVWAVATRPSG
jgi:SAM-dependent methyltransferase